MGKSISVAYEEAHECAGELRLREATAPYLDQVQQSLAGLGSADQQSDVARNAKYVRGAKKAGLEPKQAAAMILAMSQRDPADYQPRYRYEDVAETAKEYIAVDHRGKKVFGPTRDYGEAKMHADRSGGVVRFEMAKEEPRTNREGLTFDEWLRAARLGRAVPHPSDPLYRDLRKDWKAGIDPTELAAREGPHTTPAAKIECTVDSATAIAQQIPSGPWKYLKTYPKEAPARIERRRDFDVKMPDGSMGRVTANFCGKHLLLVCPKSGSQFLFESVCVGDVPGPASLPPRPEVQPVKGKPFTVKIRRGRVILQESGPFAKVTEAVQSFQDKSGFESGDTATVYDGAKVADYRGGRAVFGFGRTRWSRA